MGANLIADIRKHGNHVTAGDVGFHYVVRALMENGRGDVLHDILTRTDPPSYGAQLERGATALTEAWDANPTKTQNHFMLGHAETWLYAGLAGIRVDLSTADPDRISIAPQIIPSIASVSAQYRSALGAIGSAWSHHEGRVQLNVTIPTGAVARVTVPASNAKQIQESGRPASQAPGVLELAPRDRRVVMTLGSGQYSFNFPLVQG